MARRRYAAASLVAAVVLSTAFAFATAGPATAKGVNPAHNISISGSMSNTQWYVKRTDCQRAPGSTRCENAVIAALNHARKVLGQRPYRLSTRFRSWTAGHQLLALVNDDRALYRLPRVQGRTKALNAAARLGAELNIDPRPVGHGWVVEASNWAGGMASPLFAYYGWMYGDGLNTNGTSNNIDCSRAVPSGCWSHRDNILRNYGRDNRLLLGIGYARTATGPSWTQLFQAYPLS
ncbi:MAG TPA: hypothetical protein VFT67_08200 [Jatrophihabitantaceae bacterium]|jgi:hypothetical protein|nr:hypothetical protein [Jatrophihabitantaceae bacterium]